jgi:archaellum biogenesis ATPase FlaH
MTGDLRRAVSKAPGRTPEAEEEKKLGRAFLGAPVIDQLLPEGISYATQLMVIGGTGVGKSVLAAQFLYEGLLVGDACVYVACDETPDNMRQNVANLRLGTNTYEKAGRLIFVDAFSRGRSRERLHVMDPNDLEEFFSFEKQVLTRLAGARTRLVVDSISTILGTLPRVDVLEFGRARLRFLGARRTLALDNYVTGLAQRISIRPELWVEGEIICPRFGSDSWIRAQSTLRLGRCGIGTFAPLSTGDAVLLIQGITRSLFGFSFLHRVLVFCVAADLQRSTQRARRPLSAAWVGRAEKEKEVQEP